MAQWLDFPTYLLKLSPSTYNIYIYTSNMLVRVD